MNEKPARRSPAAAFFDVDGTLAGTNIVHYLLYFRRRLMSRVWHLPWLATYLIRCLYYLVLDRIDRTRFNEVFYHDYAGLPAAAVRALADDCYRDVLYARRFEPAWACVASHRRDGRRVVLVTGSIDFIVAPLVAELDVDGLIAPGLIERNGCFTGELGGPPVSDNEKAARVRSFAESHDIDLASSYAYGDSVADLPMLEAVGFPHVVNPRGALAAVASRRGWPVLTWRAKPSPTRGAEP